MQKEITFEELESYNFSTKSISNSKFTCSCCKVCSSSFSYGSVKKFMLSRKNKPEKQHLWKTCQKCWLKINTIEDKIWIKKNRDAQLIAQNKPEQKKKNAEGVSKSWTKERRKKTSDWMKNKHATDPEFRKTILKNFSWTNGEDIDKFNEIMRKSKNGGLSGVYNDIIYDSALELSYILWCFDNNIKIKRYDLPPIDYEAEDGKIRKYFPDFIINNETIVEIKGRGKFFDKQYPRYLKKIEEVKNLGLKYIVLFSEDHIVKYNYKKAVRLHHANKKEGSNTL